MRVGTPQACGHPACASQWWCSCPDQGDESLRQRRLVTDAIANRRHQIPLAEAASDCRKFISQSGEYMESTLATAFADWDDLVAFATRFEISAAPEITSDLLRRFLEARDRSGGLPSVGSQHRRRTSASQLFRMMRFLRLVAPDSDPTADLILPPRTAGVLRSLTDHEIRACEWAARYDLAATRYPATLAIAEASATPREQCGVHTNEIDIDAGVVMLGPTKRTRLRTVPLTEWGLIQIRRHFEVTQPRPEEHFAFGGLVGESRRTTISNALDTILKRAGIDREPDVTVSSIRAWAGQSMRERGEPIERVARFLGMSSTDRTFDLIGEDWASVEDFSI